MQPTQITSLSNRAAARICRTAQSVWAETEMLPALGESLFKTVIIWEQEQGASHWAPDYQTQVNFTVWRSRKRDSYGWPKFGGHLAFPVDRVGGPSCCTESAWMLQSQAWGSQTGTSACSLQPKSLSITCVALIHAMVMSHQLVPIYSLHITASQATAGLRTGDSTFRLEEDYGKRV